MKNWCGWNRVQGLCKEKQLKSSKCKVFLNVKCIFHEFQYDPTCHRLIYYSLMSGGTSCANYVSVHWQSLTSDDVSLMHNIPSSENWDMFRSVGVLVHFQLSDISVTKWLDYDALRWAYCSNLERYQILQKKSPYKALEKFSKALYGTTGGTYSACVFRPVMNALSWILVTLSLMVKLPWVLEIFLESWPSAKLQLTFTKWYL